MNDAIPRITTARLVLRAFVPDDFERFAEIWSMPEVVRHIGAPRSRQVSWRAFLANAGSWALSGMGQWAIEERATGCIIGQTGFFDAMRQIGAGFGDAPECGWVLVPDVWRRGYGIEAVAAAHEWFDAAFPGQASHALISEGHVASEAIARRLGYAMFGEHTEEGVRLGLWRRPAQR